MRSIHAFVVVAVVRLLNLWFFILFHPFDLRAADPAYADQSEHLIKRPGATKRTLTWVGCGVSKRAFMDELATAYTQKTGIKIRIEGGGATLGIRSTAALKSDMGGSCRHVLPVEEEENARLVPVAWDALVVIVNTANPVNDLTLAQLKSILTGKIENWEKLGGPAEKIHLIIREQGPGGKLSGVGMMTRELVFFDREKDYTDDATAVKSTGPLEEVVENDTRAVGVTGVSSARRRNARILRLNGISPSYEKIASGEYPLFRPLYLVLPKRSDRRNLSENFAAFALSDEGQNVLKNAGTVSLEDGAGLWRKYRKKMLESGVKMGDY